ncbi:MAG: DUF2586 domain-containing protein [Parashewanella sp.]
MSLGKVQVNNLNLGQGDLPSLERHFLFIGRAGHADEESKLFSVNSQTDIEADFKNGVLRDQLVAAQANAGQNWTGAAYCLAADEDWQDAVDRANETQSFEAVVLCDVLTTAAQIKAAHDKVFSLQAKLGRFVFVMIATAGINKTTQTWSDYEAAQAALVKDIAKHLVIPVPQLHGNNLGVLAGRLATRRASIADTPMRTETGPTLKLGAAPVDKNEKPLELSTLGTLAKNRLSVPQWYPDLEGVYWGDGSTLDAKGGDYQYIEHLRPVLKASREVRILAIQRIGNRRLNSTPNSIEQHKTYFMTPLRRMSKTHTIGDDTFPGDIKPPKDGDISINWLTKKNVTIGMLVRPYSSGKEITVNLALDLK